MIPFLELTLKEDAPAVEAAIRHTIGTTYRTLGAYDKAEPHHRAALTLRYADGLPVPDVAECLGRTVHATEALLVRARRAFRSRYEEGDDA